MTRIGDGAFFGCSSLKDVWFGGSEPKWESMFVGGNNEPLNTAKIHFESVEMKLSVTYDSDYYYTNGVFIGNNNVVSDTIDLFVENGPDSHGSADPVSAVSKLQRRHGGKAVHNLSEFRTD